MEENEYGIEEDEEPEVPVEPKGDNKNIRQLREKAKKADDAEKELLTLKRERAFEKAGVDLEHPLAKTLLPTYTGDLTTEAVKAWLEQVGANAVFGQEKPEPKEEASPEQLLEAQERQALAGGAEPAGTVQAEDPWRATHDKFVELRQSGMSSEDAWGQSLDAVWAAAAKGDQRVLVPNDFETG